MKKTLTISQKIAVIITLSIGIITMFILLLLPKPDEFSTKELAKHFYSFYYTSISADKTPEEIASYLETYTESGFSTTMEEALKIISDEEQNKVIQAKSCDTMASKFTYYPKAPFTEEDYEVDIQMSCPK